MSQDSKRSKKHQFLLKYRSHFRDFIAKCEWPLDCESPIGYIPDEIIDELLDFQEEQLSKIWDEQNNKR